MFNVANPMYNSLIAYTIVMMLVFITKPNFLYKNNKIIPFGVKKNQSIISLPILSILIAVILYVFFYHLHNFTKLQQLVAK